MKRKILIIILIILLVLGVGVYSISSMNISNSKKNEDEFNSTTTTTISTKISTTREKFSIFKNKELSYWEDKAREYYISTNKNDGIIVYSEATKDGITIYITLNDKILDVYQAKEDTEFKNIENKIITLE